MGSFDRKANVGIRNVDIKNVLVKDDGGGCKCLREREFSVRAVGRWMRD